MTDSVLCDVSHYHPDVYYTAAAQAARAHHCVTDAGELAQHTANALHAGENKLHTGVMLCDMLPACPCSLTPERLLSLVSAQCGTTAHAAANATLVHAFLYEGMRCHCGADGAVTTPKLRFALYGSRGAEERLAALRSVLHDVCHVDVQPPLAASVADVGCAVETREQYWRRLARHYIDTGVAAATAAVAGGGCDKTHAHEQPSSTSTTTTSTATGCASAAVGVPRVVPESGDPFYMIDLGRVVEQMARWRACLPMVRPFYAVKCNPNLSVMRVLAALGAGFDCASRREIDLVLDNHLVSGCDDVIFANPCKQVGDLRAAAARGVTYVTFDSMGELDKLAQHMPDARALLRLRTDDSAAVCAFSTKFGAALDDVEGLLQHAVARGVELYGVSFHVGSGNGDASAYVRAVHDAHAVFALAARYNYNCTVLDIGGGYPGTPPPAVSAQQQQHSCSGGGSAHHAACSFEEIAAALRPVLTSLFPDTTIISEPGRYFTAATHALAMNVFGTRRVRMSATTVASCRRTYPSLHLASHTTDNCGGSCDCHVSNDNRAAAAAAAVRDDVHEGECVYEHQYYVNDGLYHSFNCILYDHAHPTLLLLDDDVNNKSSSNNSNTVRTPTHDDANDIRTPTEEQQSPQRHARPLHISTVFGPTCDSLDCILKQQPFPEAHVGDWLLVPDMGSYTTAAGCAFNGFATRRVEFVSSIDV